MTDKLTRRSFLKLSAAATVGMTATGALRHYSGYSSGETPPYRYTPLDEDLLPRNQVEPDVYPSLTRRYPWVRFGEKPVGLLQIATSSTLPAGPEIIQTTGLPGERIIKLESGSSVLPWTPMFSRPTRVYAAEGSVKSLARNCRLFIKDEGSETVLLYGNKIRKYEFLLPNHVHSGVRKLRTYGSYGSNHCVYLTLAARYGGCRIDGDTAGMDVEIMLYPQELSENVLNKLRLLVASGAKLHFLDCDAVVGLSIIGEELKNRCCEASTTAYVPPGGSSPLSVLGHVEAVMELAEQIESGDCPLAAPPDYIFVPLGSGSTAMGLVLGCLLLGWPTKVVGTCSMDKERILKFVVNGDINTPFLVANAASLLEKALKWVEAMGLPQVPSSHDILQQYFAFDSESWHPAYGKVTPDIARESSIAGESGLVLDNTFSAKAFHTLLTYEKSGMLDNKKVLFWNTYQRFPLDKLLPKNDDWLSALPESVREKIDAYQELRGKSLI
jgi:1-aminocyclopropane-1-carboxylate deaminase/D-cysteine desulfhydrase-like pyridoxal-dependent ACC family enzyme